MKKKGTQKIDCWVTLNADLPAEGDALPPNATYEMVLDYPMSKPYRHKIKTGRKGMAALGLLHEIKRAYEFVYANRKKYGPFSREMVDLAIEGIKIDHEKKTVSPSMGS